MADEKPRDESTPPLTLRATSDGDIPRRSEAVALELSTVQQALAESEIWLGESTDGTKSTTGRHLNKALRTATSMSTA